MKAALATLTLALAALADAQSVCVVNVDGKCVVGKTNATSSSNTTTLAPSSAATTVSGFTKTNPFTAIGAGCSVLITVDQGEDYGIVSMSPDNALKCSVEGESMRCALVRE